MKRLTDWKEQREELILADFPVFQIFRWPEKPFVHLTSKQNKNL